VDEIMNILEPNSSFDFSKLSLGLPNSLQGGAYFTKLSSDSNAVYIQTPKCTTRQGFVKTGKKINCDLMFESTCEEFAEWIENLETKCRELIYEKSNDWFQNNLDPSDIETAFSSPIKVYKSGKYYLMRCNVKINNLKNTPLIKIYDENETPVPLEDVTSESSIISILEITGIKFTSRTFQLEIDIKQAMIMNKENLFESCLIKKSEKSEKSVKQENLENMENSEKKTLESLETVAFLEKDVVQLEEPKVLFADSELISETLEQVEISLPEEETEFRENEEVKEKKEESPLKEEKEDADKKEKEEKDADLENIVNEVIKEELQPANDNLLEIEPSIDSESLEIFQLKKPNEVYNQIYKEAREKAKEAKKQAIVAYLEAKNIKKTYMLDDLDSSSEEESIGTFSEDEVEESCM
jgi:hypothetical protein